MSGPLRVKVTVMLPNGSYHALVEDYPVELSSNRWAGAAQSLTTGLGEQVYRTVAAVHPPLDPTEAIARTMRAASGEPPFDELTKPSTQT